MDIDELAADEADNSEGALTDDRTQWPPLSTMGTDSEPDLTFSNEVFEDEESGSEDEYKPDNETGSAGQNPLVGVEDDEEEARLFQEFLALRRKGEKKKTADKVCERQPDCAKYSRCTHTYKHRNLNRVLFVHRLNS